VTTWSCASCGGENPGGTRFCGHCGAAAATSTPGTTPAAPPGADPGRAGQVSDTLRSFVAGQVADRLVEAGGDLPEERRLITALFADVSGFTSLADRLDPEELLEVIDPVISALSRVVGRYEGYVEKFAGDALLALFGAPIAHEDDAERAVHVALEMHRELARVCNDLGPNAAGLTLHVGVNSGHGIARVLGSEARMDYAVLGDSVILAQRLESAAPSGETYVSDFTYRLTSGAFAFEPVGELTLKGKAEAVHAWRLVGERASLAGASASSFVGREHEVEQVDVALRALAAARGAIVEVTGEPGVGKSRLTVEVRTLAEQRGVRWLETRCLAYGAGLAYWPYATLVRAFAGIRPEDDPATASERLAASFGEEVDTRAFFARLLELPATDDVLRLEPEAFRRGLHDAFASWLRALAAEQPTVLAIEDVHWADASSLALTEELARMCAASPLALYLIARPEGAPELARIAAASDCATVCSVALDRLGADSVEDLVSSLLAGKPPARLARDIADRTGGNPFFVEETVRALRDSGDLFRANGSWELRRAWDPDAMPPTVEGLLASRIDLLPRPAASLLQTASVIGRRMRIDLLEAVAVGDELDEPLERLVESTMLDRYEEDGRAGVSFHHALVQDVAYSRLLRRRRRDLHLRVAEVAEELFGAGDDVIDLLARHLYLAEAGEKAVEYLLRAGRRARRLFANDEAIVHLSRALELAPGDVALRLELADLHALVGSYDEALELYVEVRDTAGDVHAWSGIAAMLRNQGEYAKALEAVDDAFRADALADVDLSPLWLEQARTLTAAGRPSQAVDVLEAGLATRDGDRDRELAEMLSHLARAEWSSNPEHALEHALRARELFAELDDLRGLATAERVLGDTYHRLERLDDSAAALRRALDAAERVGNAEEIGGALLGLGLLEFLREDIPTAIECDRRAIAQFERIGHTSGRAQAYANLGYKLSQAGEYAEALTYCERGITLAREIGDALAVADVTDTIAAICLAENDLAAAVEHGEEAARLYLEVGAIAQAAGALEIAANALEAAGERARATETRERAKELDTTAA